MAVELLVEEEAVDVVIVPAPWVVVAKLAIATEPKPSALLVIEAWLVVLVPSSNRFVLITKRRLLDVVGTRFVAHVPKIRTRHLARKSLLSKTR